MSQAIHFVAVQASPPRPEFTVSAIDTTVSHTGYINNKMGFYWTQTCNLGFGTPIDLPIEPREVQVVGPYNYGPPPSPSWPIYNNLSTKLAFSQAQLGIIKIGITTRRPE